MSRTTSTPPPPGTGALGRTHRSARGLLVGTVVVAAGVLASVVAGPRPAPAVPASPEAGGHLTTNVEGRDYTVRRTADGRELSIPTDLSRSPLPPLAPSEQVPPRRSPTLRDGREALGLLGAPDGVATSDGRSAAEPTRRTATVVANGAWSFYMSPRVLQTAKATYVGSVTNGGTVRATRLSLSHQRIDHVVLGRVPRADDHTSATFTRAPGGKIAAFWSGHGDMPVRYRISRTPESVTTFGATRPLAGSGLERADSTYTVITQLAGEADRYWLFTRVSRHRGVRQGWWLTTSDDLLRWSRAVQLTRNPYPESGGWPYLRIVGSGHRTLDIAVTDGDPGHRPVNSLFHVRYTNGRFVRSDGSLIRTKADLAGGRDGAEPLDPREGTLVHNGSGPEGRARVYDVTRGPGGRLAVGMSTFSPEYRSLKWFRLHDGRWVGSTIQRGLPSPTKFAYGYSLVHGAPQRALVVSLDPRHTTDGRNEVHEWWTDDQGGSWKHRLVARGGGRDYRNPVGPWGTRPPDAGPVVTPNGIFWLVGKVDHWTRFSTRVEVETTYGRPVWARLAVVPVTGNQRRVTVAVQQGVGGPAVGGARVNVTVRYPRKGAVPPYAGTTRRITGSTNPAGRFTTRLYLPRGTRIDAGAPPRDGWGWGQARPVRIR